MNAELQKVVDKIHDAANIVDVIGEFLTLKKAGVNYKGICPFHDDRNPSFFVSPAKQCYKCFVCGEGGDVFTFLEKHEDMTFFEAVEWLCRKYHIDPPKREMSDEDQEAYKQREAQRIAIKAAADFFRRNIAQAQTFLKQRGYDIDDPILEKYGVGYAPAGNAALTDLPGQGYSKDRLKEVDIVRTSEDGREYDTFRDRVIFPFYDRRGNVVAFSGRLVTASDHLPKYLNTAETPVFNKRMGLYALNFAAKERSVGRLVLVEGYMDTVSLRKHGVQGVVATLGTALTEEQARLMKRYAPQVWISYDGDAAGQKAALRALDILDGQGLPARVIDYPDGMDPDDFIKANGLNGFEALPKLDSTTYRMLRAKDGLDTATQDGMTQYALRCCAILKQVKSPVEMENHLRRLVNETGYDREILLRQIGATAVSQTSQPIRRTRRNQTEPSGVEKAEQELISMLSAGLISPEILKPEDFTSEDHQKLARWLIDGHSAASYIGGIQDDAERNRAVRALNFTPLPQDREKALEVAQEDLRTLRQARKREREDEYRQKVDTLSQEQKLEILRRIDAANRESEG